MGVGFSLGDEVVFVPDTRTIGWHQHSFERWGVYPGFRGIITSIEGSAIVVDGKSEWAMDASQFKASKEVSAEEVEKLKRDWLAAQQR